MSCCGLFGLSWRILCLCCLVYYWQDVTFKYFKRLVVTSSDLSNQFEMPRFSLCVPFEEWLMEKNLNSSLISLPIAKLFTATPMIAQIFARTLSEDNEIKAELQFEYVKDASRCLAVNFEKDTSSISGLTFIVRAMSNLSIFVYITEPSQLPFGVGNKLFTITLTNDTTTLTFRRVTRTLLEKPYPTNCHYYEQEQLESQHQCLQNCIIEHKKPKVPAAFVYFENATYSINTTWPVNDTDCFNTCGRDSCNEVSFIFESVNTEKNIEAIESRITLVEVVSTHSLGVAEKLGLTSITTSFCVQPPMMIFEYEPQQTIEVYLIYIAGLFNT